MNPREAAVVRSTPSSHANSVILKQLPIIVAFCHTMLVAIVATINAVYPGESSMLWGLLMVLDFPLSFALASPMSAIESWSSDQFGHDVTYSITFGVLFAVIGGLQYFLLSLLFRRWVNRRT